MDPVRLLPEQQESRLTQQTDESLVHTALRETQEELALDPERVEVLGALDSPEYSLGNRSRVWPIVVRPSRS
jgi:hypothetical protein